MTFRRTRSTIPAVCDCKVAQHEHGTRGMYDRHRCGCELCTADVVARRAAERQARRAIELAATPPAPARPSIPAGDLFVATFPFHGGMSEQRIHRVLRAEVHALAEAQGVTLAPGDPLVRIDRTGAGVFVTVMHPGSSDRPAAEVRARAEQMAWEHEQAHPNLARWIQRRLGVAA